MAAITPRASEKAQMLEVLLPFLGIGPEDEELPADQLEAATKLAADLLKTAWNILRERELYVVAHRLAPGAPSLLYGWESSETEAKKFAGQLSGGEALISKVFPSGDYERRLIDHEQLLNRMFGDMPCASCGYREWEHGAKKWDKGVLVNQTVPARTPKAGPDSMCPKFVSAEELESSAA